MSLLLSIHRRLFGGLIAALALSCTGCGHESRRYSYPGNAIGSHCESVRFYYSGQRRERCLARPGPLGAILREMEMSMEGVAYVVVTRMDGSRDVPSRFRLSPARDAGFEVIGGDIVILMGVSRSWDTSPPDP